jgi:hypothetical protein
MGGDIAIQTQNDFHRNCGSSHNDIAYKVVAYSDCKVY